MDLVLSCSAWLALNESESIDGFFHMLTKDCSVATSAMDYYALFKLNRNKSGAQET